MIFVSDSLKDAKFIQSNIKDVLKTNCGLELNQEKQTNAKAKKTKTKQKTNAKENAKENKKTKTKQNYKQSQ